MLFKDSDVLQDEATQGGSKSGLPVSGDKFRSECGILPFADYACMMGGKASSRMGLNGSVQLKDSSK
jgi:hypothetical protein